jgi:hypothetical protein
MASERRAVAVIEILAGMAAVGVAAVALAACSGQHVSPVTPASTPAVHSGSSPTRTAGTARPSHRPSPTRGPGSRPCAQLQNSDVVCSWGEFPDPGQMIGSSGA